MRKLFSILILAASFAAVSQEAGSWRVGAQLGFNNCRNYLVGGMPQAAAQFGSEGGGGAMGLLLRYDFDDRWMITGGFGLQSFGFKFTLADSYALSQPDSRFHTLQSEFAALELPVMIHYKFKPNCRNAKWVLGAGLAQGLVGAQKITRSYLPDGESAGNQRSISSQTTVRNGIYTGLRFSAGREKVFRNGSILSLNLMCNAGFRVLAKAQVAYKVDGNSYSHDFATRGSFVGLRLAYYLKPLRLNK